MFQKALETKLQLLERLVAQLTASVKIYLGLEIQLLLKCPF